MSTVNLISIKTKLALITTVILWASAFPGIRAGLTGYSPGGLALLRFLVASICLYIFYRKLPFPRHRIPFKDVMKLLIIGALTIGAYHLALNFGELTIPSGPASFIISQSPIVTIIFAAILLKEKINKSIIIGIAISVLGIGLMTLQGSTFNLSIGFFYILFAAVSGGIYSVLQKPYLKKYHMIDVTACIIWGATIFLLFFTRDLYHDIQNASLYSTIAGVYLGIFPAAVCSVLWSYALLDIPASRASISLYFLPVIATLLGWLWLGEVPTTISMIGGTIALVGVWLANQTFRSLPK